MPSALNCPRIHCMAGLLVPGTARETGARHAYVANLRWAAAQAAQAGRTVLIEPINPRDMPGYFLNRQDQAHAVVQEVGAPNLQVQMDLYHCQIVEGDLATKLRQYLPTGRVGHLQIAGVPERHEPDLGRAALPLPVRHCSTPGLWTAGSAANTGRPRTVRQWGSMFFLLSWEAPEQGEGASGQGAADARHAHKPSWVFSALPAVGLKRRLPLAREVASVFSSRAMNTHLPFVPPQSTSA
jgi:hypothetical protein